MAVRVTGAQKLTRTANLPTTAGATLCAWMRPRAALGGVGTYKGFLAFGNNSTTDGIYLGLDDGVWGVTSYDAGAGRSNGTLTAPGTDVWAFLALTINGTGANAVTGYSRLIGVNALSAAQCSGPVVTMAELAVGSSVYDGTDYADAAFYNVKCWDRVLSSAELLVESHYLRVMFPASLNFHWPLDRHTDTNDYSGNVRNPTVTGTFTTEDGAAGLWVPKRKFFFPISTGGISGTLSATLAALTSSSASVLDLQATTSKTLGALTLASAGTLPIAGVSAQTLAPVTLSSASVVALQAALAQTLADLTLASAGGATAIVGVLSQTLADATLSSAGTLALNAQLAKTLDVLVLAAAGVVPINAALAQTLGVLTLSSSSTIGGSITGTAGVTLGAATVSSQAAMQIVGQLSAILSLVTLHSVPPQTSRLILRAILREILRNITRHT